LAAGLSLTLQRDILAGSKSLAAGRSGIKAGLPGMGKAARIQPIEQAGSLNEGRRTKLRVTTFLATYAKRIAAPACKRVDRHTETNSCREFL